MSETPLLNLDLPGVRKIKSGKVREIFDLGDRLLFVATDRISAFDCIMPNGIPRKGEVLTQLSHFWFDQTEAIVPNHRLARSGDPLPGQADFLPACTHELPGDDRRHAMPATRHAVPGDRCRHPVPRGCHTVPG